MGWWPTATDQGPTTKTHVPLHFIPRFRLAAFHLRPDDLRVGRDGDSQRDPAHQVCRSPCAAGVLDYRRGGGYVSGEPGELSEAAGPGVLVRHRRDRVADVRNALWAEISGRPALDQDAGWRSLSAVGVGEADPDSGGGQVLCRFASTG